MKKLVFIAWVPYHRRTELLAQHLDAAVHYVYVGQQGRFLQAPLRYLVQAGQTWRILRRGRPEVVFVQNPPIFSVLVVCLYARGFGARYVIDSHTGAFVSSRWRLFTGLHRMLSGVALATIVHNRSQEDIVKRWGCRYLVLGFTPGDYSFAEHYPLDGQFNVAVVSTFAGDEPLDVVFEAARRLPEVRFYVTGDSKRIAPPLLAEKPHNCHLTGYLPYPRYVGVLREAHAVMDLTDRDHTLLMGGFEAVSLGIPLITSDWPVLKDYFSLGTVHVPNTVEGICEGVRQAQRQQERLRREILCLREQLLDEWEQRFAELRALLREDH